MLPSPSLKMEANPVPEILYFIAFIIPNDE
jgi:hypothetical protein